MVRVCTPLPCDCPHCPCHSTLLASLLYRARAWGSAGNKVLMPELQHHPALLVGSGING